MKISKVSGKTIRLTIMPSAKAIIGDYEVYVIFFQVPMSTPETFPKSVVLHFPPNVYQKIGASEILPQLLQKFEPDEVRCVQFLRGGKVRVTFRKSSARDFRLTKLLHLKGYDVPVTRDDEKLSVLHLRDLPYEVHADDLQDFFSAYGTVLAMERSTNADFPSLCDGNRVIKMILKKICRIFSLCLDLSVVCGIVTSRFSISCAVSMVIVPRPVRSLAGAGAVISRAMWPESAHRPGAQSLVLLLILFLSLLIRRVFLNLLLFRLLILNFCRVLISHQSLLILLMCRTLLLTSLPFQNLLLLKQYCLQLDIALWCKNQIEHSIWDESVLLSNCARSLEFSSSSTLAGLSYHICGKLEVAFKASPSSQHQHCTDEAQKAETVLSAVRYSSLV